jgi:biopolymer transport protein ExbB
MEEIIQIATYIPIAVCSILGFGVFITKALQFSRVRVFPEQELFDLRELLEKHGFKGARKITEGESGLLQPILLDLLSFPKSPRSVLKEKASEKKDEVIEILERRLDWLSLIATLGPLLGLLGTVVGIVLVFGKVAVSEGLATPHDLAGGIGIALYTTLFGLIVGVFALVSHLILSNWLKKIDGKMVAVILEFVDLLAGDLKKVSDS